MNDTQAFFNIAITVVSAMQTISLGFVLMYLFNIARRLKRLEGL